MDCASCASHVQKALAAVDGVSMAEVRLAGEKAVVRYDPARADVVRLAEAVAAAGYTVPPDAMPTGVEPGTPSAPAAARRALGVAGLVFGAVLVVVVVGEWLGLLEAATRRIPFVAGVAIVVLVGWPAFDRVVRAALSGRVLSHTLMTVGVLAALAIGQWATAAVVAFFMRIGETVEGLTLRSSRRALRDLESLAPRKARVERGDGTEDVAIEDVRAGEVVVVRPGERIPVDGAVVGGSAAVKQAAITGESMPVDVGPGDRVFAATIAEGGALRVRVERTGPDATFGRIVRMVEEAESRRGRVETWADRFSGRYLPVVLGVAAVTLVVRRDPLAVAAVLVVACSCAFAIATPVAMLATIGAAARRGLLLKGGASIEALARADVVLVDKTGTFTEGRPTVARIATLGGLTENEVLRLAAAAERDSEHPLAAAIRDEAARRRIEVPAPARFEARAGAGVVAEVDGWRVAVGNERITAGADAPERFEEDGLTAVRVLCDDVPVGVIGLQDALRPDVPGAIAELRALGLGHIELLTGDTGRAAAPVARRLGIPVRAGLLPEDKIRIVHDHQREGRTVVMIGDGVNDAPALAQADVGIALGAAASDLALEVAHVALLRDDWSLVPEAFRSARRTLRVVRGNFALTALYNLAGLTLAALGFLPPAFAAAAQSIPDLGILGNSARLLRSPRDHAAQDRRRGPATPP
jgi:Cd2+/Zn2+-exporting ATPase/Cu+-exporting ATPase